MESADFVQVGQSRKRPLKNAIKRNVDWNVVLYFDNEKRNGIIPTTPLLHDENHINIYFADYLDELVANL